jgi:hypothetical protein
MDKQTAMRDIVYGIILVLCYITLFFHGLFLMSFDTTADLLTRQISQQNFNEAQITKRIEEVNARIDEVNARIKFSTRTTEKGVKNEKANSTRHHSIISNKK